MEYRKQLAKARRLMLMQEITPAEYREIKAEYQPEINSLEARVLNCSTSSNKIDDLINKAWITFPDLIACMKMER